MFEYLDTDEQERLKELRLKNPFANQALLQLDRILDSPTFERVGRRAKDFVGFVVAKKLLSEEAHIKETTIAGAVYKEPNYDPLVNNKIRVAAIDIRKKLLEYADGEGAQDPMKILLPKDTYVPTIQDLQCTLALVSFENWNPDSDQDHLCRTVSEEIAQRLKHTGAVQVTRVPKPQEDGARYGLRGSLEVRGDILRLNVSLSDRAIRRTIFSQTFEENRDDLLKLARKVAETILDRLKCESCGHLPMIKEFPERFEALRLYQQGRFHFRRRTQTDIRRAIELFEQALEANGEFARAHSGLADCYLVLSWYALSTPDRAWFEAAKEHALRARALNPLLPEAHTSLGYANLLCDFDWAAAEQEFRQAIQIQNRYAPAHHWYANLLVMQGRFAQAEEEIRRAFDLDPGSIVIRKTVGDPYYYSQRYDQAIKNYNAALRIDPTFWMAHLFLGLSYSQIGEPTRALVEFDAVTAQTGMNSIVQGAIGHLYGTFGRQDDARAILKSLHEDPQTSQAAPHTFAVIHTGLGEIEAALDWLNVSYENRIELLAWVKVDPRFRLLRSDPRFDEFLVKIGLGDTPKNE